MNERDIRQLRHLRQRLLAFKSGRLIFFALNADAEALINQLEDVDETSRNEYLADWGMLEQVVADEADLGTRSEADSTLVSDTVERLLRRVEGDLVTWTGNDALD